MGCATAHFTSTPRDGSKGQIPLNFNYKVSKGAKIGNRYNQVPHLTQDTNWKVTNSQLDTTSDHKAHKTDAHKGVEQTQDRKNRSTKEVPPWNGQ